MGLKTIELIENKQEKGWPFANSEYFASGEYKIHYRIDAAKGKEKGKMFMIHGFGCNTTFYDELVEEYTKKGYRTVRVDLPDFGFSTREINEIAYKPRVDMLVELMDYLDSLENNPDKWIVVGHSMGGSVTLDIADLDLDKVKAYMLYAPMFMFNVPKLLSKIFRMKWMGIMMDTALKYVLPYDALVKAVLLIATMSPRYIAKYDASLAADSLKVKDTGKGLCYMSSKASHPAYEDMKKIKAPVLLVWGGLDLFVPKSKVKKLSESLPDSTEIHTIPLAGHCLIQNFSKKSAKYGMNFIKTNNL